LNLHEEKVFLFVSLQFVSAMISRPEHFEVPLCDLSIEIRQAQLEGEDSFPSGAVIRMHRAVPQEYRPWHVYLPLSHGRRQNALGAGDKNLPTNVEYKILTSFLIPLDFGNRPEVADFRTETQIYYCI
jgi:hypothetical protein